MAELNTDDSGTPKTEDVKTFTQEEVNKLISERVNRLNATKQNEMDEALSKARAEWEESKRLESLSGQEKIQAEYDAKLSKAQREQESINKELQRVQMELAISKAQAQLAGLNLPPEFAPNLLGKTDEETSKNIQLFSSKVNELVAKMVNENVARGSPKLGATEPQPMSDIEMQIKAAMGTL